jgi:hypothetical protein
MGRGAGCLSRMVAFSPRYGLETVMPLSFRVGRFAWGDFYLAVLQGRWHRTKEACS